MLMCEFKVWRDLIRAHSAQGKHNDALVHFLSKIRHPFGFKPDHLVLQTALKSCALLPAFTFGKTLHTLLIKLGHLSCLSLSKGILNVYAKSKSFEDCKKLFNQMSKSDTVAWNIVLAGLSGSYIHDDEVMSLVYKMHATNDAELSPVTTAIILPVCGRLGYLTAGKSIHCYAIKHGSTSETLVGNSLMSMYAKCGKIHDGAYPSFCEIDDKDVVSWNAVIAGFSENGCHIDAYTLFRYMLMEFIAPNYATIASVLSLSANLNKDITYRMGKELHAYVVKQKELKNNVFVVNALMSFYFRMGLFKDGRNLFDGMNSRDLISWNAIFTGCVSHSEYSETISLFQELVSEKIHVPNSVTLISVIPACAHLQNLKLLKQIHGYSLQRPILCNDITISNALINSYAKCDDLNSSFRTFMMISKKDLISWNSMIDAFADNGCELEIVSLLNQMIEEGIRPDSITVLTLIRFYGSFCKQSKVKQLHGYFLRTCHYQHILCSSLLEAYGKCGNLDYAHKTFWVMLGEKTLKIDLMTWNLMIRAYVSNNDQVNAISLFLELQLQGMNPDATTIISILPIFPNMGSTNLVQQCHGYVIRACIDDSQLKAALIDIYSKCGFVNSAAKLLNSSPKKDLFMFTSLIGGCAMHGMGKEALLLLKNMLDEGITPDDVVITTVLSACSHSGLIDEGLTMFYSIDKVYKMKPTMEQYGCVVDLLARQGKVKEAYMVVTEMPMKPNARIWSILLAACRNYHELELGQIMADHLVRCGDKDVGSYVALSNIHALDAKWNEVLEIRKFIKRVDFKKPAGCSWV